MIPKVIILDGVNGNGAYSVAVKGNIAGNQSINVNGQDSFKLSEQTSEAAKKADITAQLAQVKKTWNHSEINKETYTYTTGSITAADISAGYGKVYLTLHFHYHKLGQAITNKIIMKQKRLITLSLIDNQSFFCVGVNNLSYTEVLIGH